MFTTVPTEFECTDDAGELIFKISAFDADCASIEIKSVVTPASWPEISAQILHCLDSMKLSESAIAELSQQAQKHNMGY